MVIFMKYMHDRVLVKGNFLFVYRVGFNKARWYWSWNSDQICKQNSGHGIVTKTVHTILAGSYFVGLKLGIGQLFSVRSFPDLQQ